jgi:hypothetical protein
MTPQTTGFRVRQIAQRCWLALAAIAIGGSFRGASGQSLTHAERLVVSQAQAGNLAEFKLTTVDEQRTIRAEFLAPLLMGMIKGVSHEGVRIQGARISGKLELAGATIPYAVWLNNCDFLDDVDLSHTLLHGDLSLKESTVHGAVDLDSLNADGNVVLDLATFEQDFDISDSKIGANLDASGATFQTKVGAVQFNNIVVAKRADLDHMTAQVPLILDGAEAQILVLGKSSGQLPDSTFSAHEGRYSAKSINLNHATIHRELQITGLQVEQLLGVSLKAEGLVALGDVQISKEADLSHSQLFSLSLMDDISWPKPDDNLLLAGIWFQYINPGAKDSAPTKSPWDDEAKWQKLSDWVDHASSVTAPYQLLEDTLKREGRADQANEVYERRERKAWRFGGLSIPGKIKNFLMHWLIGYGREPQWALYWSIPVILFGWYVFRRKDFVQVREEKNKGRPYDPLWYSIDLFLPLSTLQAADVWIPDQNSQFRRYYARVYSILGWILIPIGLAAVSGIISGK